MVAPKLGALVHTRNHFAAVSTLSLDCTRNANEQIMILTDFLDELRDKRAVQKDNILMRKEDHIRLGNINGMIISRRCGRPSALPIVHRNQLDPERKIFDGMAEAFKLLEPVIHACN